MLDTFFPTEDVYFITNVSREDMITQDIFPMLMFYVCLISKRLSTH